MIKTLIFFCVVILVKNSQGQDLSKEYFNLCNKADSLYIFKDYKNAALVYSSAFRLFKAYPYDQYHAACAWTKSKYPDSSFFFLNAIATISVYIDKRIAANPDLKSLHKDKRWKDLITRMKVNEEKVDANLNKPLAQKLDSILTEDQKYRRQSKEEIKTHGHLTNEFGMLWKKTDSLNLIAVKKILDKDGWPGREVVGKNGGVALFLVIQHADLNTQEKYLPVIRTAVKTGKTDGSYLAYLEDRVLIGQGKNQIYGTQLSFSNVSSLDDPDNVDSRRAFVGLPPLKEYLKKFDIKWDVKEYKRQQTH